MALRRITDEMFAITQTDKWGPPGVERTKQFLQPAMDPMEPYFDYLMKSNIDVALPAIGAMKTVGKGLKQIPKYAGSVNLFRQKVSDEARKMQYELWQRHGIKSVVSHEELIRRATKTLQRFRNDPEYLAERLKAIRAGKTPTIEEELAHRIMNASHMEDLAQTAKMVAKGEMSQKAFNTMEERLVERHLTTVQPLAQKAGQRLNMYNIEVGKHKAIQALSDLGKHLNKRQIKELAGIDWNNPVSVEQFVKRLPNPKLRDYLYEFWYNSILSGLPTHVVNAASNTAWITFQLPHRSLTGIIDAGLSAFTGKTRQRFINELIPMMAGYTRGTFGGTKRAAQVIVKGRVTDFETKWAQEVGAALGAFERSPHLALRAVAPFVGAPTRALRALDVWGNSIAFDGQLRALARRQANKLIKAQKLKSANRTAFEKKFASDPPQWAIDDAMKFAKYSTFMDDPGKFTQSILKLRESVWGGRLIIPFVNTIGNLLKRGTEMTPGLGLTLAKGQEPAEVIAKQIEGSILALYAMHKMAKGEITGALPQSETEREAFYRQGKLPWAIKYGDTWYQYRRIEPFNVPLAMTAMAYDEIMNAEDEESAIQSFGNAATAFKNYMLDSSYLQGMSLIFDRYGKLETTVRRQVGSFVPFSSFWRSINRAYEAATEREARVRETDTWLGAFSQVIPGMSAETPARLNVWGEEITLPGGVLRQWLPYKWSEERPDIVEDELERIGLYPGLPGKKVTIQGREVELDDLVYRDYAIVYGRNAKAKLEQIIRRDAKYHQIKTAEGRAKYLDSYLSKIRNEALDRAKQAQMQRYRMMGGSGLTRIQ